MINKTEMNPSQRREITLLMLMLMKNRVNASHNITAIENKWINIIYIIISLQKITSARAPLWDDLTFRSFFISSEFKSTSPNRRDLFFMGSSTRLWLCLFALTQASSFSVKIKRHKFILQEYSKFCFCN